jgi:hypothetical protein
MTDWDKLIVPTHDTTPIVNIGVAIDEIRKFKNKVAVISIPTDLAEERIKNKVPTHDPYTNPNAAIYYECSCGAILDPGTKSFAALNGHAEKAGWKIRFGPQHYIPYCVKCGERVE